MRRWLGRAEATIGDEPRPAATIGGDHDDAIERVRAFLADHGLDPRPAHYQLGWRVVVERDPRLIVALNAELAVSGGLTPELVARLTGDAAPEATSDLLDELMIEAGTHMAALAAIVGQSRDDAQAYGDVLEGRADELNDAGLSHSLLAQFVEVTRALIGKTRTAETRLRDMDGQIETLRANLDEASRAADCDPLTGLANRRSFERRLARAIADADADRSPLTLGFCDLDHFKRINDQHGHEVGDRVLKFVAELLVEAGGEDMFVARFGGEEFVMLCEHVPFDQVVKRLDALRYDLGGRRLKARGTGEPLGDVTISIGVAAHTPGQGGGALLRAADRALYRAKETGRDRVVTAFQLDE